MVIKDCLVSINGVAVSPALSDYHYVAYFCNILGFSGQAQTSKLEAIGFYQVEFVRVCVYACVCVCVRVCMCVCACA